MRVDCVHGVRPRMCNGEQLGELVHGTGYHDRSGAWKNGSRWIRRYPDAKVSNRMSRHALRCRDAFHVLRDMPDAVSEWTIADRACALVEGAAVAVVPARIPIRVTRSEAREQAVRVLMHLINWLGAP